MLGSFNAIMNGVFDLVTLPFQAMHPVIGLTVISLVAGVVLLLLFKYTSPQDAIAKTKTRLWGNLHEIRLFKDELGVISRAIGRLIKENAVYFGCCAIALVPMVAIVLPVMFQLDARYGFEPLHQNDRVILNVVLADGLDPTKNEVKLDLPAAVELEAGPVRIPSTRELVWRLRLKEEGVHEIKVEVDGQTFSKRVDAESDLVTISPGRYKSSRFLDALMFPAEKPFDADAQVEAITLTHNRAAMLGMAGDTYPWLVIFCVVGLLFGFALKGVLKVNL